MNAEEARMNMGLLQEIADKKRADSNSAMS
jgi:hypothetical protein